MRILWNYYLFLCERIFAFLEVRTSVLEVFFLFCEVIERKKPGARECCSVWLCRGVGRDDGAAVNFSFCATNREPYPLV